MLVSDGFCILKCYTRVFFVVLFFLLGCGYVASAGVVLRLVVLLGKDKVVAIEGYFYSFTYY
jgi:hypothetical protein